MIENICEFEWDSFDKTIDCSCNSRRPDFFKDFFKWYLIIEFDENQHKNYNIDCERNRLNEIYEGLSDRPGIILRFNPDSYKCSSGKRIKGAFSTTKKTGKLKFNKKIMRERLGLLQERIEYFTHYENVELTIGTNKLMHIEKLFFDFQ